MKKIVVKDYDTKREIARIGVKKLDRLFEVTKYLTPEMLRLKDCRIIDFGVTQYSVKDGIMSNDPEVNGKTDIAFTGRNSTVIGPGASTALKDAAPSNVKVLFDGDDKPTELSIRLSVTAYPEGYVINSGKMSTNIFGVRKPAYFASVGKRNFKCASIDGAHLFSNMKAVLSYLEKYEDVFRYMVKEYGYSFSVEPASYLFASSLEDIPAKDTKLLNKVEAILAEINSDSEEDAEEVLEGIATPEEIKVEAKRRLEKLGVMNSVVQNFESGKLFMSEFGGMIYDLNESAKAAINNATKRGFYPYAVCRNQASFGDSYAVLAVGKDKEEWQYERADKYGMCCAYVYNADHPELSEYGEIQIVSANGGLMRVAQSLFFNKKESECPALFF